MDDGICPAFITHYFEAAQGPFKSLSDLDPAEAESVLGKIRQEGVVFASRRNRDYLEIRRALERKIRQLLIDKGGQPRCLRPHYFILGSCDWVKSWYRDGRQVAIPLDRVEPGAISFTYGDSFPAMRYQDGKPYRGQVYRMDELPGIVRKYGLPQEWNSEGKLGPERYIEAQVWDDEPVREFLE